MPYEVLNNFRDTKDPNDSDDKKVIYEGGEEYPRDGYEPPEARIEELSKEHPKYERVFIKEVEPSSESRLTKKEIKKMNKDPQEKLIKELGGNPDSAKNEDERIALILELQEKKQSESESSPE